MTKPPVHGPAGVAWTCDGCGRSSLWTDEHQWYGSYEDIDGGKIGRTAKGNRWDRVVVTCSEKCRTVVGLKGLVPPDAELLRS